MKYLLLVDSHLRDVYFLLSTVTSEVTYVLFDTKNDTPESIMQKIPQGVYSRVGIVQENSFTNTYEWLKSLGSSVLKDVSTVDSTLQSWGLMIQFLQSFKGLGMEHLDFIECNLGTPDWLFVTQSLEQTLNIEIHHSTGVIGEGGSWTLDNDPAILTDDIALVGLYFTDNVRYYRYSLGTLGGTADDVHFRGAMHVITNDNKVYSWGQNMFGCFGIGNSLIHQQVWSYTLTPPSSFPSIPVAIDGGVLHTMVCLQNGTVYGMGLNGDGQTGTLTGYGGPTQTAWYSPVIVPGITTAVDVACGGGHTLILLSNGDVMGLGYNYFGQLAIQSSARTSVEYNNYTSALVQCILPEPIKKIYATIHSSIFIGASGSLYVAGDNYHGFIGLGEEPFSRSATKINVAASFQAASMGYFFTLALDTMGNIWGTGRNYTYQLGTNVVSEGYKYDYYYDTFRQITSSTVYASISAGYSHAGAIDTTNRLWMWGENQYGPLGDGTNVTRSTPTMVKTGVHTLKASFRFTIIGIMEGSDIRLHSTGLNSASRLRNIYDDAYQSWTFNPMYGNVYLSILDPPVPVFTYPTEVVVSVQSIQPSSGTTNTPVLVSGANLDKITSAFYGLNAATFTLHSTDSMLLTTPAGSGNVSVSLLHPGGTVYAPTRFTYANPSISGMNPLNGPSGSEVAITGFNLSNTSSVRFNTSNTSFATISGGLNVSVPVGAGNVSVWVTDAYGNEVIADRFTFQNPSLTQNHSGASRSTVALTGAHLSQISSVKFDQTSVSFVRVSDSVLNVSVPVGSNPASVSVIDSYQNTALTTFTYANPSISGMSPSLGLSGISITLTGSNLANTSSVRFNTSNTSFAPISGGLNVSVPVGAGNAPVWVTDIYGNEVNAGAFTYQTIPVQVPGPIGPITLSPTTAVANYPLMITDTGSRFSNDVTVFFGNLLARHVVLSATKLRVYVPEITAPCPITIVLPSGNVTTELFTRWIPSVQSISSTDGSVGDTITITGSNLASIDYVTVGTYSAQIIDPNDGPSLAIRSNVSITCILPYGVGTTPIYLKDKWGNSLDAGSMNYLPEVSTYKQLTQSPIAMTYSPEYQNLYVSMGSNITYIRPGVSKTFLIELDVLIPQITGIAGYNGILYMAVPGSITQSIWTCDLESQTFSFLNEWNSAATPQVVKIYKNKIYVISNATTSTADTIRILDMNGNLLGSVKNYDGVWLKGIAFYQDFVFVSVTSKYSSLVGSIWKMDLSANLLDAEFITGLNNPIDLTSVANYLFIDGPTIVQYNIDSPSEPVETYSNPNGNYNAIVQGFNETGEPVLYMTNLTNNSVESIVAPPHLTTDVSLSEIDPLSGTNKTRVGITGINFLSSTNQSRIQSIQFGGIPATDLLVVSSTQLYCNAPAGTGTSTLKVIDSSNREIVSNLTFEYRNPVLTSYTPREGSENDLLTIVGSHLDQVNDVLIGLHSVKEIVSVNQTQMIVKIPAGFSSNRVRLVDTNQNRIDNTAIPYTFNYLGGIEGYYNDGYYQSISVFYKTVGLNQTTMPNFRLDLTAGRVIGSVGFGYVFYSDETFTVKTGQSPTWSIVQGLNPFQIATEEMYAIGKLSFLPGSRVEFSSFKINGIDQVSGSGSLTIDVPPLSFETVDSYSYSMPFNHITDPAFYVEMTVQPTTGSVFFGYMHENTMVSKTFILSGKYVIPHGNLTQGPVIGQFILSPGSRVTLSSFKVNGVEQLNGPITFQSQTNSSVLRSAICFPANTYVKTDQGQVAIQKLVPSVHTLQGKSIVALTKTYCIDDELVLIEKDALRKNYPNQDTWISKRHKVYFRGKMKAAQRLVGKYKGISFVPYQGEKLYNVLLEDYGRMSVHGMLCETLHPANPIAKLFLKNI